MGTEGDGNGQYAQWANLSTECSLLTLLSDAMEEHIHCILALKLNLQNINIYGKLRFSQSNTSSGKIFCSENYLLTMS